MSSQQLEDDLAPLAQTLRVIVAALLLSVVGVSVAMVYLRHQQEQGWKFGEGGVMTLAALAFAIAAPLLGAVISRQTVTMTRQKLATGEISPRSEVGSPSKKRAAREADIEALALLYQTKTIVLASVLEGSAFFCAIAFLIEGDLLTLFTVGLAAIGIASQYPTIVRVANWVEDQLARLQEERAMAR